MSNIMAAIGIEQLKRFPEISSIRVNLAKQYNDLLQNIDNIYLLNLNFNEVVPHIYVVRLAEGISRKYIAEKLLINGIQTGFHYQPNHHLAYFENADNKLLTNTEIISNNIISLPLHEQLSYLDIKKICEQLKKLIAN